MALSPKPTTPTLDRPQIRDFQYLITDGKTFFHEEKRHLKTQMERPWTNALAYRVVNSDPDGRYQIEKQVITDPHLSCVLQHTRLKGDPQFLSQLRLYALCAPHLEVGGWGNSGYTVEASGRGILAAEKHGTWLALAATLPFRRLSCGYVGQSDGWTDLDENLQMDREFDQAPNGNIALMGELDLDGEGEFTLGLALGDSLQNAVTTLLQGLGLPFEQQRERYADQWSRPTRKTLPVQRASGDQGRLYDSSVSLLLAHEDKNFPGAFIASLSIPWGEMKGDEDTGGYHLVWTRDMVQSATALLACGHTETPLRALIYLAACQQADGGFPQNFWLDGEPYWRGVQLDEIAYPIILAWRMHECGALAGFDPYSMVMGAATNLVLHRPATAQERWEEASGYSPSTIAVKIAALLCAASFARAHGEEATAQFIEDYADFLECHVEAWTVTTQGTLVPGIKRHYIRINPVSVADSCPDEDPNTGALVLANRPPETQYEFPAKEIVDAGFLELVRYGIRRPDDPIIVDSLKVIDAVLKVETPFGPCWRRYSHDGYGQRNNGSGYDRWGTGRAWPLLIAVPCGGHKTENNGRVRFLSPQEEAMVRNVIRKNFPEHEPELDLSIHTGLRSSEQYEARWRDVDFERRVLTIPLDKGGETSHVPLNAAALRALLDLRRLHGKTEFVCGGTRSPRYWFEAAIREAKIEPFTWHCLRHTFASRLVMSGADLRTVAELLRDKTPAMVMRYAHLGPDQKLAAVERMEALFPASRNDTKLTPARDGQSLQTVMMQ